MYSLKMTEPTDNKKEILEEILNRKNLGEKKYHSETSLQKFGEEDEEQKPEITKDPGVHNRSVNTLSSEDVHERRRRTVSQPGPGTGSLVTATADRKRRRPPRNVMYAADLERTDSTERLPKFILNNKDDYGYPLTPLSYENTPSPLSYNGNGNGNIYGNFRNGDIKSLSSYRINTPTEMRGGTTPRKRSVATMDAQSIRSVETQAPPPTTPEENARLTVKYLTLMLSCMYAVLLVTLGFIVYLTDPFLRDISTSPIYSLVLLGIGFLYHIYLVADITRYKKIAVKNQKIKGLHDKNIQDFFRKQENPASIPMRMDVYRTLKGLLPLTNYHDECVYVPYGLDKLTGPILMKFLGNVQISPADDPVKEEFGYSPGEGTPGSTASQTFPSAALLPMNHDYCFSHGRHSGSFYLKLGAAGFALGHLIHSVLQITVQVGYLVDDDISNDDCLDYPQFAYDIASPLYCFIQLYFIFKYSNVHILKAQGLAHFGFMHMIGSSLCFWVYNIVRETVLALTIYAGILYGNQTIEEKPPVEPVFVHLPALDVSILHNENCTGSRAITSIIENFSPYLYPFGVEYNILIVAVYYIIWSHIGICDNEDSDSSSDSGDNQTICKIPTASEENDYTSNIVIHADCHASNKGLFVGLILSVAVAGLLILGFVFSSVGSEYLELGYFLNSCTKLGLHILMLFAVVIAYNQTRKLDINENPVSLLDDILLFICLPAFFMETVFSLIATINILNIIKSIDVLVMALQVIIQTTLLVDGLRRCSNSRKLRRSKPGREVLMFLLIGNVAMWLLYTFSYKAPDNLDERYEYYGKVLWSILGHICLPLIMFYRFHSSVCFADIWGAAYKPGSDH